VTNQIINLNSLKNTDLLARLIAKNLFPKAIVLLWGEMGSGKTTFAKSLCSELGVQAENVTSPTYTIANIYQGLLPIFHIDHEFLIVMDPTKKQVFYFSLHA